MAKDKTTAKDIAEIDKLIDELFGADKAPSVERASGKGWKKIWPAVRGILLFTRNTIGIIKPAWKIAIDAFIMAMDAITGTTPATV